MSEQEIESKLKEMIVDRLFLSVKPEEIVTDASLVDVYGVESVFWNSWSGWKRPSASRLRIAISTSAISSASPRCAIL